MDAGGTFALLTTAASIGVVHTLLGPDHYLPFVALGRARSWPLSRTLALTAWCGVGHVAGSIALGALGVAFGWALSGLVAVEELRGRLAGWLLLAFGLAYLAWGVRRGLRERPHRHAHAHGDGTVHAHGHDHLGEHAHPHDAAQAWGDGPLRRWLGPWTVFVVFVLGPCEPLIPVLMYPAAGGDWGSVAAVAAIFATATISTMLVLVGAASLGLARLSVAPLERWSHAAAGAALAACGLAVTLGL